MQRYSDEVISLTNQQMARAIEMLKAFMRAPNLENHPDEMDKHGVMTIYSDWESIRKLNKLFREIIQEDESAYQKELVKTSPVIKGATPLLIPSPLGVGPEKKDGATLTLYIPRNCKLAFLQGLDDEIARLREADELPPKHTSRFEKKSGDKSDSKSR